MNRDCVCAGEYVTVFKIADDKVEMTFVREDGMWGTYSVHARFTKRVHHLGDARFAARGHDHIANLNVAVGDRFIRGSIRKAAVHI